MKVEMRKVQVEPYNPQWAMDFHLLQKKLWPLVDSLADSIEHVGSTSVPGLWAKPVIDIDIIIRSADALPKVVENLKSGGYEHLGNLGIEGREAFNTYSSSISHNLYVCFHGCMALRNHLTLRDHLIKNEVARANYSALKRSLAERYPFDIDSYVEGKTSFILGILENHGVEKAELDLIETANRVERFSLNEL